MSKAFGLQKTDLQLKNEDFKDNSKKARIPTLCD